MKIFVIVGETGEYSDRNEWVEIAFTDKSMAEEYIRLMETQESQDWDDRTRYELSEIELLDKLPKWDTATRKFIT